MAEQQQAERIPDDLIKQAKSDTDLRKLAEKHTTLEKETPRELSGPCPRCGGDDRFHVTAQWFMCRQCHEQRGDAVEFLMWLHGKSFREAVATLAGGQALVAGSEAEPKGERVMTAPKRKLARFNKQYAEQLVARASKTLFDAKGEPGQDYLRGRGLDAHTWQAFGLGYVASSPTAERVSAIVLPWYKAGELVAVRFRFLEPVLTVDKQGEQRSTKLKSLKGSRFAGLLFGGQAEPLPVAERTLFLCEGELNAMSVWQVAHESAVDVLSVGSESQRLPESLAAVAARYGQVVTWLDRPELAKRAARALPGAAAVNSEQLGGDANDLLQAGHLGGIVAAARYRACQSAEQRETLLWALWDAAGALQGIDAGSAQVFRRLAGELGKSVALAEVSPGRYMQERERAA